MNSFFYIDLFSGAGGTTTGIHMVGDNVKVLACVNHDSMAIESHKANHPECIHFIEDVRDWNVVVVLSRLVKQTRRDYPGCIIALWASLECTNYSKAKGGLPRDADSRTLAHALYMYIEELNPDYIDIENVREFMAWGPLDETGRPISKLNGRDYLRWVKKMCSYGYQYDWKLLNAADYGAYTSRERYFGQFALKGLPIVWPEPTHSKKPVNDGLFDSLNKWNPVKDVLDLEDEGHSIFVRKKPLSEKTLERIYAGLIKFVAGGKEKWLMKCSSMNMEGKHNPPSIEYPCPVVSCQSRLGIVSAKFISKYYSGKPEGKNIPIDGPAGTVTCVDGQALVSASFLSHYYGKGFNTSIDDPCPVLRTKDSVQKIQAKFMTNYYSGGGQLSGINTPCPTITGVPKQRLTSVLFLDQQCGQSRPAAIDQPVGSITSNPKFNLIHVHPWIMNTNYNNVGSSINDPAPVITASRKHHYLLNPRRGDCSHSIEKLSPGMIARQAKTSSSPNNITRKRFFVIPYYEKESISMRRIRLFMAIYGITDIKMRMLKIPELLKIQGFPGNYRLKGTKTQQKKQIGNAVVSGVAKALTQAKVSALVKNMQKAI